MPGSSAWTLGVVLVIAVALIWSASTVLVQAIFSTLEFERPVFLTYVANSCFVILLPIKALRSAVYDPPATGLLDQTAALTPAEELDEATGPTERGAAERASRRSPADSAASGSPTPLELAPFLGVKQGDGVTQGFWGARLTMTLLVMPMQGLCL